MPAAPALEFVGNLPVDVDDITAFELSIGSADLMAIDLNQWPPAPCACFNGSGFAPAPFDKDSPLFRSCLLEGLGVHPVDQVRGALLKRLGMSCRRRRKPCVTSFELFESHWFPS